MQGHQGWQCSGSVGPCITCGHELTDIIFGPCYPAPQIASHRLSSQVHYDFGMRTLKSVLAVAAQLRTDEAGARLPCCCCWQAHRMRPPVVLKGPDLPSEQTSKILTLLPLAHPSSLLRGLLLAYCSLPSQATS